MLIYCNYNLFLYITRNFAADYLKPQVILILTLIMGLSYKCKGTNLYNHLCQKGKLPDSEIVYERKCIGSIYIWHCSMNINTTIYHGMGRSKKKSLMNILEIQDAMFRSLAA